MATAVRYLAEGDAELQGLGAAFIQHECYSDTEAKKEVLKGVPLHSAFSVSLVLPYDIYNVKYASHSVCLCSLT